MRVLVLGGTGFFGQRIVAAFQAGGEDVVAGGRGLVDLARVTPAQLAGYDVVVNASDSLAAPPDRLHAATRAAGVVYLETSAELATMQRALAASYTGPGVAILGAGVFPGLSNLVAAAAYTPGQPLALDIALSPLSGAGAGMVALIAQLIAEPSPPPEQALLEASLGTRDVTVTLSLRPRFVPPMLRVMTAVIPRWRPLRRAILAMIRFAIGAVRRVILRRRPTPLAITAGSLALTTRDGLACGAAAVAAIARLVVRARPAPGTYPVDRVLSLDAVLAELGDLAHLQRSPDRVLALPQVADRSA